MALVELVESDAEQAIERFEEFHQRYAPHFATQTRTMATEAKQYVHGQLLCQRRGNMTAFEKIVPESNSQSFNHLVSNSPWQDDPVI